jgi:hypothetical protein
MRSRTMKILGVFILVISFIFTAETSQVSPVPFPARFIAAVMLFGWVASIGVIAGAELGATAEREREAELRREEQRDKVAGIYV